MGTSLENIMFGNMVIQNVSPVGTIVYITSRNFENSFSFFWGDFEMLKSWNLEILKYGRREPGNDEYWFTKISKSLDMDFISIKNMKWKFGKSHDSNKGNPQHPSAFRFPPLHQTDSEAEKRYGYHTFFNKIIIKYAQTSPWLLLYCFLWSFYDHSFLFRKLPKVTTGAPPSYPLSSPKSPRKISLITNKCPNEIKDSRQAPQWSLWS